MRKILSLVLALAMLLSCTAGVAEGKVFNTVLGGNPTTLDPIMFRDANANSIIAATHESLVRFDETGFSWEPGLAKGVVSNEDATVWTFTLRDDAFWSDGTPVTVEDVIYSFQRAIDPAMASPNVNDFFIIDGAREVYESRTEAADATPIEDLPFDMIGVKDIGDNKIQFTMDKPTEYFLDYVRLPVFAPVQKKAAQAPAEDTSRGYLRGSDYNKGKGENN